MTGQILLIPTDPAARPPPGPVWPPGPGFEGLNVPTSSASQHLHHLMMQQHYMDKQQLQYLQHAEMVRQGLVPPGHLPPPPGHPQQPPQPRTNLVPETITVSDDEDDAPVKASPRGKTEPATASPAVASTAAPPRPTPPPPPPPPLPSALNLKREMKTEVKTENVSSTTPASVKDELFDSLLPVTTASTTITTSTTVKPEVSDSTPVKQEAAASLVKTEVEEEEYPLIHRDNSLVNPFEGFLEPQLDESMEDIDADDTSSDQIEVNLQPKLEATLQPKLEATLQPKLEATLQPKVEANLQPKLEASTVQQKVDATVKPQVEDETPKTGSVTQPTPSVKSEAVETDSAPAAVTSETISETCPKEEPVTELPVPAVKADPAIIEADTEAKLCAETLVFFAATDFPNPKLLEPKSDIWTGGGHDLMSKTGMELDTSGFGVLCAGIERLQQLPVNPGLDLLCSVTASDLHKIQTTVDPLISLKEKYSVREYPSPQSEAQAKQFIHDKVRQYTKDHPDTLEAEKFDNIKSLARMVKKIKNMEIMSQEEVNIRMKITRLQRTYRHKQNRLQKLKTPRKKSLKANGGGGGSRGVRGPGRPKKKTFPNPKIKMGRPRKNPQPASLESAKRKLAVAAAMDSVTAAVDSDAPPVLEPEEPQDEEDDDDELSACGSLLKPPRLTASSPSRPPSSADDENGGGGSTSLSTLTSRFMKGKANPFANLLSQLAPNAT